MASNTQTSAVDLETQQILSQMRREEHAEKAADQRAQQMMKLQERELDLRSQDMEMQAAQQESALEEARQGRLQRLVEQQRAQSAEAEETDKFRKFLTARDAQEGQTAETKAAADFSREMVAMERQAQIMQETTRKGQTFQLMLANKQGQDAVRLALAAAAPTAEVNRMQAEMVAAQAQAVEKQEALERMIPQALQQIGSEVLKLKGEQALVMEGFQVGAEAAAKRIPTALAGMFVGIDAGDTTFLQPRDPSGRQIGLDQIVRALSGGEVRVDFDTFDRANALYGSDQQTIMDTLGTKLAGTFDGRPQQQSTSEGGFMGEATAKPLEKWDAVRMVLSMYGGVYRDAFGDPAKGKQVTEGLDELMEELVSLAESGKTDSKEFQALVGQSGLGTTALTLLEQAAAHMQGVMSQMKFGEADEDREVAGALRQSVAEVKDALSGLPAQFRARAPQVRSEREMFDLLQQTLNELGRDLTPQEMRQVIAKLPTKELRDQAVRALTEPMRLREELEGAKGEARRLQKELPSRAAVLQEGQLREELGVLRAEGEELKTGESDLVEALR